MGNIVDERILKSGSPPFTVFVGALAAGAVQDYDLQTENDSGLTGTGDYLPLDYVEVTNDDVVPIYLIINQVDKFYIPAATIKKVSERNIWRLAIQNVHASTTSTANKIVLVLQRKPLTVDTYMRKYQLSGRRLL